MEIKDISQRIKKENPCVYVFDDYQLLEIEGDYYIKPVENSKCYTFNYFHFEEETLEKFIELVRQVYNLRRYLKYLKPRIKSLEDQSGNGKRNEIYINKFHEKACQYTNIDDVIKEKRKLEMKLNKYNEDIAQLILDFVKDHGLFGLNINYDNYCCKEKLKTDLTNYREKVDDIIEEVIKGWGVWFLEGGKNIDKLLPYNFYEKKHGKGNLNFNEVLIALYVNSNYMGKGRFTVCKKCRQEIIFGKSNGKKYCKRCKRKGVNKKYYNKIKETIDGRIKESIDLGFGDKLIIDIISREYNTEISKNRVHRIRYNMNRVEIEIADLLEQGFTVDEIYDRYRGILLDKRKIKRIVHKLQQLYNDITL